MGTSRRYRRTLCVSFEVQEVQTAHGRGWLALDPGELVLEPETVPESVPVAEPPAAGSGTGRSVGKVITGRSGVPLFEWDWPPPELAATVEVAAQRVAPKPPVDVTPQGDCADRDGWGRPARPEASRTRLGETTSITGVTGAVWPGVAVGVDGV